MEEKILTTKKNGMPVMLLTILLLIAALVGVIFSGIKLDSGAEGIIYPVIYLLLSWMRFCIYFSHLINTHI